MQSERMAATDTRALTPAPHHTPCVGVEGRGWARWFFREAEAALAFAFQLGETETVGWSRPHCPFVHTTEQAIASSRSGVAGDGGLEQAVPLSRSSHRTGRGWAPGVEPVSCRLLRWKEAQVALLFSVVSSEPNLMPVAQGWT